MDKLRMGKLRNIAEEILHGLHKLAEDPKDERNNNDNRKIFEIPEKEGPFRSELGDYWIEEIRHQKKGKVYISDLGDFIRQNHGRPINFYPSEHKGACCDLAVFVSITGKKYTKYKKKGTTSSYNFSDVLEAFCKHMQGDCVGITHQSVIITDSWNPDVWEQYRSRIKAVMKGRNEVEIYLITDPYISEIDLINRV